MNKEEKNSRQVRKVTKRVAHPCYDSTEKVNDIMLLKVRTVEYVISSVFHPKIGANIPLLYCKGIILC